MKQTSWLSGLAAVRNPQPAGLGPHLVLGHLPHREEGAGQLVLAEHGQHVGLVLQRVGPPAQAEPAVGGGRAPGMVAGGHGVEAQGPRPGRAGGRT